jgi:Flp pilus assembly protein TadG
MKLHHKKFGRLGSATLELALTLIILLNVTYGTIEFGQYFYVKNQVQGAAREGARAAVTSGATQTDVTNAISGVMSVAGLSGSGYTVTTSPASVSSATSGSSITVTVQCTWGTVGSGYRPFSLIGASKIVKGTAVMRKE